MIDRRDFCLRASAAAVVLSGARATAFAKEEQLATDSPATDCHAHVFTRDLPLAGDRRYAPDYDAGIGRYLAMLDENGCSRGVLVQPSFLGTDNSYLLTALGAAPARLRGIAVVSPDTPFGDLEALDGQGIVGLRLNLIGKADPDLAEPVWQRHLTDIARLGWQVEIQVEAGRLPGLLPALLAAGPNVVLDHFGKPSPQAGVEDPGFRYLLSAGRTGRLWVKLSAPYRNGPAGEEIAKAAIPLLKEAIGLGHLVWGSDWPHTQYETQTNPAAARRSVNIWLQNPSDRQIVLREAPARLFRFNG